MKEKEHVQSFAVVFLTIAMVSACGAVITACSSNSSISPDSGNSSVPSVEVGGDYIPQSSKYDLSAEYPKLGKDNIFKASSAEEVFRFIEHGTGILMLGYPECPWCQYYLPMVEEIAREHGIDKIVYYDVRKSRLEDPESYAHLLDLLGGEEGYPRYNPDGELRIFVPFLACLDHGEVKFADSETCDLDSDELSPEEYWNEEHVEVFKDKLSPEFEKTAEALESCKECSE